MRPTIRRRFTTTVAVVGALAALLVGATSTFAAEVGARVEVDLQGAMIMPLLIISALVGEMVILVFFRENDEY